MTKHSSALMGRLFLVMALFFAGVSAVQAQGAGEKPAQDSAEKPEISNLLGSWSINWQGAQDKYAGKLDIARDKRPGQLAGKVTLLPQSGGMIIEEARITFNGNEIRIECYNPKVRDRPSTKSWNPDRFYVFINGTEMRGHSIDSGGQRGPQVIFTKL